MMAKEQTAVIGIFRDHTLAEQAIDELRQDGWSHDQLYLSRQHGSGLLSSLKSALGGSATPKELSFDDPTFRGLSDEQRDQYQHAFEQGSSIIAVEADTRPLEVRDTLHRFGAMNVILPSSQGEDRVIPLRSEDVKVQKHTAVVGELRIHKKIITENKTFTVPVTREEVTIERLPVLPHPGQQLPASTHIQESASVHLPSDQVPPLPPAGPSNLPETSPVGDAAPPYQQQPVNMAMVQEVLENGGSLKILVHEEQVMIQKQSVVVEEILIQKQVIEEIRHLTVPVRHEEAYIEREGTFPLHGDMKNGTLETDTSKYPE